MDAAAITTIGVAARSAGRQIASTVCRVIKRIWRKDEPAAVASTADDASPTSPRFVVRPTWSSDGGDRFNWIGLIEEMDDAVKDLCRTDVLAATHIRFIQQAIINAEIERLEKQWPVG